SQIIKQLEKNGDQLAIAKTCYDMIENSFDFYYWMGTNTNESSIIRQELISLGEKAIKILKELNNPYELARAYCWTSWYYLFGSNLKYSEKDENIQKGSYYSKIAVETSQKTDDVTLIGWCYHSRAIALQRSENKIASALELFKKQSSLARISKDKYLLGIAQFWRITMGLYLSFLDEDPEKNRKLYQENLQIVKEVIKNLRIINLRAWNPYNPATNSFIVMASIEVDNELKYSLLSEAVEYGKKAVKLTEEWRHSIIFPNLNVYSRALYNLSQVESDLNKKKSLLAEILDNSKRIIEYFKNFPNNYYFQAMTQKYLALAKADLARITNQKSKKIDYFKDAISSIQSCRYFIKKDLKIQELDWILALYGEFYLSFGRIYFQTYLETKEKNLLAKALEFYDRVIVIFRKLELTSRIAESYWLKAKIHDQLSEHLEAASDYNFASEAYLIASEKFPKLKNFYVNHSRYMEAWNEIEQAKYNHSREKYLQARTHYENAGKFHEELDDWNYLSPNYFAWAKIEQAEEQSRTEKPQEAIKNFQDAKGYFQKTEINIKTKLEENTTAEETDLIIRILKTSDLRCSYCQARILMEEAKLLDRKGNYLDSAKSYGKAAHKFSIIVKKIDVEAERKELEYIAILCRAWEKMANAEETSSAEVYLEAAEVFEQAKDHCYTKKASFWALGNSYFCKGLAAQNQFQATLDRSNHSKANKYIKQAANYYTQAGYQKASEYAKATQRLFDAYLYMNSAEDEVDPEKKTKYYQLAEQLLQIAADSFSKAQQADKTTQVQSILNTVREEKALAVSLNQVMQAPTIASSTLSFTAPSPTSEVSVGLESFEHANVQANLVTQGKEVKVGESFCLSVEFVNAGRDPALLMRVEDFVPSDFVVVKKPEIYRIEDTTLNMKGKQLAPLKLVEVKLTLQPSKKGEYQLNPRVHYLNEVGQNRSLQLKTVDINVEEVVLEDRISTGTQELDSLLFGGIPNEYAIVLSGSPSDEREYLIKNFLGTGIRKDEIVFYVSTETDGLENLLKNPNFILFLCNSKPKTKIPDLPNAFQLRSKTDLTNLSISLAKAYRNICQSTKNKRLCIETVSDVLLDYGAKATRKWISELITDLASKGFTMLAVINPDIHPHEQARAVIDLFDGEISITQSSDSLDCGKSILVKKLRNQDYIKNPICLIDRS
ncbi:MAG: ATPase domain-containing protein, partial [Candidatus Bathyarchaeota archaeon]